MTKTKQATEYKKLSEAVARGMAAAVRHARKVARLHGTPIYVWKNGKVVAKKP